MDPGAQARPVVTVKAHPGRHLFAAPGLMSSYFNNSPRFEEDLCFLHSQSVLLSGAPPQVLASQGVPLM
jgi:hypothetical protein